MNVFRKLLLLAAIGFLMGSCVRCTVDMASAATLQSDKEATSRIVSKFLRKIDRGTVMVFFYNDDHAKTKPTLKILNKARKKSGNLIRFIKVNVKKNRRLTNVLQVNVNEQYMPMLMFFHQGRMLGAGVGLPTQADADQLLTVLISLELRRFHNKKNGMGLEGSNK